MRCPSCRKPLDERLQCRGGHRFEETEGVLRLLDGEFAGRLRHFLDGFEPLREQRGRRIHDPGVFARLPRALRSDPEWRLRGYDLSVLDRVLDGRQPGTALDVGAWNLWLSHHLACRGWQVTAVDYFADELDGLGAHRFYDTSFRCIQLDLRDLGVLDERFDLVVVNRCLQFFVDPPAAASDAMARVQPDGLLVLTGLHFFADPSRRRRDVELMHREHAEHGLEAFVPIKGYLDLDDRSALADLGIELRPYPQLRMRSARLKGRLRPTLGEQLYGVARR